MGELLVLGSVFLIGHVAKFASWKKSGHSKCDGFCDYTKIIGCLCDSFEEKDL